MTDRTRTPAVAWTGRAVAIAAVLGPVWVAATAWSPVMHGSPLYPALLAGTAALGAWALWRSLRSPHGSASWRRVARIAGQVLTVVWVAFLVWLTPFGATEPSLGAMNAARVTESASQILIEPPSPYGGKPGVLFQPGARVDARAYVATLTPLAEAGHPVIIIKQPFGIAFTALGRWPDPLRDPYVASWVVAGHSLGGTVAAIQADDHDGDDLGEAAGLILLGSYPAGDISHSLTVPVLSISASEDGLSTPAKIDASRANLPADTTFTVIDGASHASFGDYGVQPGDGTPTLSDDEARAQISGAMLDFLDSLG